jgi:hypothetical protein
MNATEHEAKAVHHRREAVRQLKLGDAHREIGEIAAEIERLCHRAAMLEIFVENGGEGELPINKEDE